MCEQRMDHLDKKGDIVKRCRLFLCPPKRAGRPCEARVPVYRWGQGDAERTPCKHHPQTKTEGFV